MDIEKRVKKILIEQLGVREEDVTPRADFVADLGADSLDSIQLVMAFEEEFGFEIPDEDAERMKTVGDVMGYLKKKLASGSE